MTTKILKTMYLGHFWKDFLAFVLGGPNGLLPLAHQSRAVTESFGKSDNPGSPYFCDLSRTLPCHGNSDHLMSFKERVFHTSHFCALYRSCAGTEMISEAPFIACFSSGPEKGVIMKGVFSLEKSLESLKSLNSLESLENGRNLLSFPAFLEVL